MTNIYDSLKSLLEQRTNLYENNNDPDTSYELELTFHLDDKVYEYISGNLGSNLSPTQYVTYREPNSKSIKSKSTRRLRVYDDGDIADELMCKTQLSFKPIGRWVARNSGLFNVKLSKEEILEDAALFSNLKKQTPIKASRYTKQVDDWELSLTKSTIDNTIKYYFEIEYKPVVESSTVDENINSLIAILMDYPELNTQYCKDVYKHISNNRFHVHSININKPYTLSYHDTTDFKIFANNDYAVTDKADGDRMLLIITMTGDIFVVNSRLTICHLTDLYCSSNGGFGSIIDGELVGSTFYAFDILYYGNTNIQSHDLYGRHVYLHHLLPLLRSFTDQPRFNVKPKTFWYTRRKTNRGLPKQHKFKSFTGVVSFIKYTDDIVETGLHIWKNKHDLPYTLDGIIFSPVNFVYKKKHGRNVINQPHFKWKENVTIDVSLRQSATDSSEYAFHVLPDVVPRTGGDVVLKQYMYPFVKVKTSIATSKNPEYPSVPTHPFELEYNRQTNTWDIMKIRKDKKYPNAERVVNSMFKLLNGDAEHNTLEFIQRERNHMRASNEEFVATSSQPTDNEIKSITSIPVLLKVTKIQFPRKVCVLYSTENTSLDKKVINIIFPETFPYKEKKDVTCNDLGVHVIASVNYKDNEFVLSELIDIKPSLQLQQSSRNNYQKVDILRNVRGIEDTYLDRMYEHELSTFKKSPNIKTLTKLDDIKQRIYDRDAEPLAEGTDLYDTTATKRKEDDGLGIYKYNNLIKSALLNLNVKNRRRKFLLDYASGRGGDLNKWKKAGFTDILAIDNSYKSIQELKRRYSTMNNSNFRVIWVYGDMTKLDATNIAGDGAVHYRELLERLVKCGNGGSGTLNNTNNSSHNGHEQLKIRYFLDEMNNQKFDMISIQFAIHYLKPTYMIDFLNVNHKLLTIDGFIVYTYTNIGKHKQYTELEKGGSIDFKYPSSDDEGNSVIKKLARYKMIDTKQQQMNVYNYPIWGNEYSTEYLIKHKTIKKSLMDTTNPIMAFKMDVVDEPDGNDIKQMYTSVDDTSVDDTEYDLMALTQPVIISGGSYNYRLKKYGTLKHAQKNDNQLEFSKQLTRLLYTPAGQLFYNFRENAIHASMNTEDVVDYGKLIGTTSSIYGKSSTLPWEFSAMLKLMRLDNLGKIESFLDMTANVGTDTLNFAKNLPSTNMYAVELQNREYIALKKNIQTVYPNTDRINAYHQNIYTFLKDKSHAVVDVIYLDAPWGGTDWHEKKSIMLQLRDDNGVMQPISKLISRIIRKKRVNKAIYLKVPSNFDITSFRKDVPETSSYESIDKKGKIKLISIVGFKQPVNKKMHLEQYDFPYKKRSVLTSFNVAQKMKQLTKYEPGFHNDKYTIRNIKFFTSEDLLFEGEPTILINREEDYSDYNIISDYFQEECRMKCKRFDQELSQYDYWNQNKLAIINNVLEDSDSGLEFSPYDLREKLYTLNKECTSFRPTVMVSMIKHFKCKKILDFSSGWGDRLIGAMACDKHIDYYCGVDPNTCVYDNYKKMIDFFNMDSEKYIMINEPFQEAILPENKSYDLIMTSPPYFTLELYTDQKTQSTANEIDLVTWLKTFLFKSLSKSWERLLANGHMIISINDMPDGNPAYVKDMMDYINNTLPNSEYLGVISYAEFNTNYIGVKSPQPLWIWKKTKMN